MAAIDVIRHKMEKAHQRAAQCGGWRKVGKEFGVSGGLAWRIVVEEYEPQEAHIRHRLGLEALVPTPACPKCGQVPIKKHCPCSRKTVYRDLFDIPVDILREMLYITEALKSILEPNLETEVNG